MTATMVRREHAVAGGLRHARRPAAPSPETLMLVACLALGAASVVVWPTVPLYDVFSWLVWGRELAHQFVGAHQALVIAGGASWKPLPVLFTTAFGFFGSAAVTLWLVFGRTAGLISLWLAYRLGSRLGASERWRPSAPLGGILAAAAIVLTQSWLAFMFGASSEPLTITAALLSADLALRGRALPALTAAVALALMRPEAAVLVALGGAWCLWREHGAGRRLVVLGEIVLVPAAWVVPPWLADHAPLQAGTRAQQWAGNHGHDLATLALTRAEHVVAWPVPIAALALLAIAVWRREWAPIMLAAAATAYLGVIELETLHGYPGLSRFILPAAAIVSVLAGAGVARVAALARGGLASAVVAVTLVAVAVPTSLPILSQFGVAHRDAAAALRADASLSSAVARAGGRARVLPCPTSTAAVNWREAPELAWILGVSLPRVTQATRSPGSLTGPALAFLAPGRPVLGTSPAHAPSGLDEHPLGRDGPWRISRTTPSHATPADRCVGA